MKKTRQSSFTFPKWGGARKGSGRKRTFEVKRVEHRARPDVSSRHPIHVTLRLDAGFESLRKRRTFRVVRDALVDACNRFAMRIVHFAVMTNHVHLICEVEEAGSLTRGIKGLCVRVARRLNALWGRAGRVLADRYHAHVLKTPREVRNALAYLLHNARHHGIHFAGPDPCSSGAWFDGWDRAKPLDPGNPESTRPAPWPHPRTWLLTSGWRRHGPIALATATRRPCGTDRSTTKAR